MFWSVPVLVEPSRTSTAKDGDYNQKETVFPDPCAECRYVDTRPRPKVAGEENVKNGLQPS